MVRRSWCLIAASLALATPGTTVAVGRPEVVVFAFEAPGNALTIGDETWVPARLADLVSDRLARLGFDTRDRRFEAHGRAGSRAPGAPVEVSGRASPEDALEPEVELRLEVRVVSDSGARDLAPIRARAGELDRVASELALQIAGGLGSAASSAERARLLAIETPFPVQRLLGLARTHLDRSAFRKALVMYDRAAELEHRGVLFDAYAGRRLAEAELAGRGEATFAARADLAPPAAVRAEVARRRGDDGEILKALTAYLRFTPEHAERWRVKTSLERGAFTLIPSGNEWVLQSGEGDRQRWRLDPRTGAVLERTATLHGLVGLTGGHAIALDKSVLTRFDAQGRPRWKVSLPLQPRGGAALSVEITNGMVGVMGSDEVAWVDTSFGELGQRAKGVRPFDSGPSGILVEIARGAGVCEVALLRPGKKTPAWSAELGDVLAAKITTDRVLALVRSATAEAGDTRAGAELVFLRTHDGKETGRRIPIPKSAQILMASGRYAVVDLGDRSAALIDVLSAEQASTFSGPSKPLAAVTAANGVSVLYATGDLLFFDRDGVLLDRALPPGQALDLVAGSPITPGPVAITTEGMFAYAEVANETAQMRDVQAMIEIARALHRRGEVSAALDLVEQVAMLSAGHVAEAETLRAELSSARPGGEALARAARARALRAKDPRQALGPFVLAE